MSSRVSIIVPIYNVEMYLKRCIDSIINQTHTDLEIILVDDGSPDNCGNICDKYSEKDNRIRVIHKANGGLSDARNVGIDIASGEYLMFVDSDDWIAENAVEALLKEQKYSHADIVLGASIDVHEENGNIVKDRSSIKIGSREILDRRSALEDMLLNGWAAWNKLYKKYLFSNIRFPVGVINEDEAILLHVIMECNTIVKFGKPTYFYFLREESITTSQFNVKKMDWYYNCLNNCDYINKNYKELNEAAIYRLECSIIFLLFHMYQESEKYKKEIDMIKVTYNAYYKSFLRNKYNNRRRKIEVVIYKVILDLRIFEVFKFFYNTLRSMRKLTRKRSNDV